MAVKQPDLTAEIVGDLRRWKKLTLEQGHAPWVRVTDVNKMGRRHLVECPKQKRTIHLLSDGEYRAYQILIWRPNVIAVYEQVPLHIPSTLEIARQLNIVHQKNYETNEAYVASTDFVVHEVNLKSKQIEKIAYSFKYFDQFYRLDERGKPVLKRGRTLQKQKIEREYWRKKGVIFRLITELNATKAKCWNIDWFTQAFGIEVDKHTQIKFCELFLEHWYLAPLSTIQDHIDFACKKLLLSKKQGITLFKLSALDQLLPLDLSEKLKLYYPVKLVS